MPHKKTYSLKIGPKHDLFGLERSSPIDPILVSDNLLSDFSLSRVEYAETDSYIKTIKSVQNTPRKTRILSNTADVRMTDVFAEDGTPLFYKALIRNVSGTTVYVNDKVAQATDLHFIYLNEDTALVEYRTSSGDVILSESIEVFPVFIWEEQENLIDVMQLDNKKYYFRLSKGDVLISASKTGVYAEVDNDPVFTIKRTKNAQVRIEPFYIRTLISNDAGRLSFEYNYINIVTDYVTRTSEQKTINSGGFINLNNTNVFKDSVVISRLVDKSEIEVVNNSSRNYDNIIFSIDGRINIQPLLEGGLIDYSDKLYVSYRYIRTSNTVTVDSENFSLEKCKVHFRIKPTKITKQGVELNFVPDISYIITDLDGNIAVANDADIPSYEYRLPIYLGYGEEGYGENGFSGTTESLSSISININNVGEYSWGWGEQAFGEGPFGGSYIRNILEVQDLLDIKNNNETGTITIGALVFNPEIKTSDIYPYKQVATVKQPSISKQIGNYANIVWNSSIDGTHTDMIDVASVDVLETYATISLEGSIPFQDLTKVIIEFDLSPISAALTPAGDIDPAYVVDNGVNSMAVDDIGMYNDITPSGSTSILDLSLYSYDDSVYSDVAGDIFVSDDMKKATVIYSGAELDTIPTNIGLGFKTLEQSIYPSVTVNL